MAALGTLCTCLTALDRRDGRRCEHDSWGTRRPSPDRTWASPHDEIPFPLFLIVAVSLGVLFVALLLLGQTVRCAANDHSLSYCPGYSAEQTNPQEPRP
jgi:hypothetical protein